MTATKSILVVDDDPSIRRICQKTLSASGYDVALAENVEEAQRVLSSEKNVDFVLTDLQMPGTDGWQLIQWALRNKPAVGVGLMTGSVSPELLVKIQSVPGVGLLSKPFTAENLRRFVQPVSGGVSGQ